MTFPLLIAVTLIAISGAFVALFKFLTAREALRGVPSSEKPAVLDALGGVFDKWRR